MINILIPETDQQELWELNGRVNALRGLAMRRKKTGYGRIDVCDVEAVMGWDEPVRRNGHPAMEEEE